MKEVVLSILQKDEFLRFGITALFIAIIIFVFLRAYNFYRSGENQKFVAITPNLLTGIGVLGTFVGIFLGLLEFDVKNITDSIPPLLDGMKIAFATSICGMFAGLIMRFIIARPPPKGTTSGAKSNEEFVKLVDAISTSILEIRSDSNKNHKELVQELRNFAEEVSKNSTEAIVESLEKVVKDFNKQVKEQFGDNFRHLNEAVEKLLEWQENYKEKVASMQEQFQRCLDSINEVEKAMASIKENTETIPLAMEKLPEIMKSATETLDAFATMKDQAISAFPTFEENIAKLTSGLESQVQAFANGLEVQQESYKKLEASFDGLGGKTQEAMDNMSKEMQKVITTSMKEVQESMKQNIEQTSAELRENFAQFDKEAGVAIQRIGDLMGSVIDAIVEDYLPIAERLRERLNASKSKGRGDN